MSAFVKKNAIKTVYFFFFQAEDGIRDDLVTGVQTCALPISARTHATNAARSETLRDSLWHLGHVVNCLEGKGGKNYDANNLNPCQGQGGGILPDLQAAARNYQMGASTALDLSRKAEQLAMDTLKLTDLAQVKGGASKVADMLGEALKTIGQ